MTTLLLCVIIIIFYLFIYLFYVADVHEGSFIVFMVCSMIYMFFSCVLLKLTSSQPITTEVCNITLFITVRIGGGVGGCAGDEVGVERQVRSILLFGHYDFQITDFYVIYHQQSNISNKINNYFIHVIELLLRSSFLINSTSRWGIKHLGIPFSFTFSYFF